MAESVIGKARSFNRTVTEVVGALNDEFMGSTTTTTHVFAACR
jgi:hypothetical protein